MSLGWDQSPLIFSQVLLKQLDVFLDSKPVDVFPFIKRCTLDIICGKPVLLSIL